MHYTNCSVMDIVISLYDFVVVNIEVFSFFVYMYFIKGNPKEWRLISNMVPLTLNTTQETRVPFGWLIRYCVAHEHLVAATSNEDKVGDMMNSEMERDFCLNHTLLSPNTFCLNSSLQFRPKGQTARKSSIIQHNWIWEKHKGKCTGCASISILTCYIYIGSFSENVSA